VVNKVSRALLYNSKAFCVMIKLEKYTNIFKTKKALDYFLETYEDQLDTRYEIFWEYIPKAAANTRKKVW